MHTLNSSGIHLTLQNQAKPQTRHDDQTLCHDHVLPTFPVHSQTHWKYITLCLPLSVDSCYCDIVGQELIGQCQSEVRVAAVSCIHWVSRCHCWFILNLIVDGSIRVEWGEPVQFNSTGCCISNYGQHAWWGWSCMGGEGYR